MAYFPTEFLSFRKSLQCSTGINEKKINTWINKRKHAEIEQLLHSSQADRGFKKGMKMLQSFQGRTSEDSGVNFRFMNLLSMSKF